MTPAANVVFLAFRLLNLGAERAQAGSQPPAAAAELTTRCRNLHSGAAAAMPVTDLDVERAAALVSTGQAEYLDVR